MILYTIMPAELVFDGHRPTPQTIRYVLEFKHTLTRSLLCAPARLAADLMISVLAAGPTTATRKP